MKAYLTLTLDEARKIVAPGLYHEHWEEAQFAIQEHEAKRNLLRVVNRDDGLHRFGDANDPNATHFVMTFVRMPGKESADFRGCRGQILVVMDPARKRSVKLTYGPQIYDTDPLLRPMKIAQLLASVGQPKGAKR